MTKEQYESIGLHKLPQDKQFELGKWIIETVGKAYDCSHGSNREKITIFLEFAEWEDKDNRLDLLVVESGVRQRLRAMPDVELAAGRDGTDFGLIVRVKRDTVVVGNSPPQDLGFTLFFVGVRQCKSDQLPIIGHPKEFLQIHEGIAYLVISSKSEESREGIAQVAAAIDTTWLEPERRRRAAIKKWAEEWAEDQKRKLNISDEEWEKLEEKAKERLKKDK